MADLTNTQGSTPVEVVNETSGNTLAINSDGGINENLAKVGGTAIALGQTTMSASVPVVMASNQTAIPVTTEGQKTSYSAAAVGIVVAAAATDVFTIIGSATKTIRVTRIVASMSTTAGSGIAENASLVKRSTADTGGTSTTPTVVPHDSNNAAGTAVVRSYTANPTLGTAVGTIRVVRSAATTAGTTIQEIVWEFGTRPAQAIVLRGVDQQLCINLGGVTITGPVADFSVEWTEE